MMIYDFSIWLIGPGLDNWVYGIMSLIIAISFVLLTIAPLLLIFGFSRKSSR